MNCPCGSNQSYLNCCGLFIEHKHLPKTAEQLMRSRYCAYALNNIDYIYETMRGTPRQGFSKKQAESNNALIKWQKLDVLHATDSTVEFIASYINEAGQTGNMHEKSLFKQKNNRWFYIGVAT